MPCPIKAAPPTVGKRVEGGFPKERASFSEGALGFCCCCLFLRTPVMGVHIRPPPAHAVTLLDTGGGGQCQGASVRECRVARSGQKRSSARKPVMCGGCDSDERSSSSCWRKYTNMESCDKSVLKSARTDDSVSPQRCGSASGNPRRCCSRRLSLALLLPGNASGKCEARACGEGG